MRTSCIVQATIHVFYPFHPTGLFLYPQKTPESLCFSVVFRGVERHQMKRPAGIVWKYSISNLQYAHKAALQI